MSDERNAWVKHVLSIDMDADAPAIGGKAGGKAGGTPGGKLGRLLSRKPPPIEQGSIGPAQSARALKLLAKMPPGDQKAVEALLQAAPAKQQAYLEKAIASKHSRAEIEAFNKAITGKDEAWMQENLHVVGGSTGKGIMQQWHDSCGPTTVQAMRGELDPIYAFKLRTENPNFKSVNKNDGAKLNASMAQEQKTMLEAHGGTAVSRSKRGGNGMVLEDGLNDVKAATGLTFSTLDFEQDQDLSPVLVELDKYLADGLPVPMRVGDAGGGHFVLVTGMRPGPPRTYAIHDPWDGKIINVTDKQFVSRKMNIAGYSAATDIYRPSADPADAAGH